MCTERFILLPTNNLVGKMLPENEETHRQSSVRHPGKCRINTFIFWISQIPRLFFPEEGLQGLELKKSSMIQNVWACWKPKIWIQSMKLHCFVGKYGLIMFWDAYWYPINNLLELNGTSCFILNRRQIALMHGKEYIRIQRRIWNQTKKLLIVVWPAFMLAQTRKACN